MKWPRFFAPSLDPSAPETTLPPDESHHLVRVMRLGTGDEVAIFDGRGHEMLARVARVTSKAVTLQILRPLPSPPAPRVPIVLAQAVLKGDKMDAVVRDATMAGVSAIVPIVSDRSLVSLSALTRGHAVDRWQRVAISSAKQCGRAHLPHIHPPCNFGDWLKEVFEGPRLLFVAPAYQGCQAVNRERLMFRDVHDSPPDTRPRVACIVGPEGGWAEAELGAAGAAGCSPVTLGSMTLRADAAGLVAVSIVSFLLENP